MENLAAFIQTNKQIQKGVTQPNKEIQDLIERLKNL